MVVWRRLRTVGGDGLEAGGLLQLKRRKWLLLWLPVVPLGPYPWPLTTVRAR